jgi:hypothetical protein
MSTEDDLLERFAIRVAGRALDLVVLSVRKAKDSDGWIDIETVCYRVMMTDVFVVLDDPRVMTMMEELRARLKPPATTE